MLEEKIKQLNWFNFLNRLKNVLLEMVSGAEQTPSTVLTAIQQMTTEQKTAVKTALGIVE